MTLLSLYTACVLLPLICLALMIGRLIIKKRGDIILCTECQSCITHCPVQDRHMNAFQIMLWGKTGTVDEPRHAALNENCIRCGLCKKDCPRGIAPYALLPGKGEDS